MKETINPTERAAMDAVREKTRPELSRRVPRIDHIDHRRLVYFLIEDRIADYKAAGREQTLTAVLEEFGVNSKHTYYDWCEKWRLIYVRSRGC